jgi:AraC-like DNA-binding protein
VSDQPYEPDADDSDHVPVPRSAAVRKRAMGRRTGVAKRSVPRGGGRIISREKQRKALELRKGGATYDQIADACGYSDPSGARKAVVAAFGELIQEPATEVKSLQVERLNHMLLVLWPKINQGDERAIDTSLRIMDKMDRLMGTEAASTVDVNVHQQGAILVIDGSKEDFIRSMKQMATGGGQAPGPALPPADGDAIIEGEIVEEKPEVWTDVPDDAPPYDEPMLNHPTDEVPEDHPPKKKTYSFGVDPITKKGD